MVILPVFGGETLNESSVFFENNSMSYINPAYLTASGCSIPEEYLNGIPGLYL
jgi:hypothetical protein